MDLVITISSLSPEKLTLSLENGSLQERPRPSSPTSPCIAHQFSSRLISRMRIHSSFSQRQSFHLCSGPVSPLPFTRTLLLLFPFLFLRHLQFVITRPLLEKEMVTSSSILAWKLPWAEEPGGLQSTGSQGWARPSN